MTRSASRSRASASARSSAPGSSGFGKATVGKSGSGCSCCGTGMTSANPAASNTARSTAGADAVHRGVHDAQVARAGRHQADDGGDVVVDDLLVEPVDAGGLERDLARRADGPDRRLDLGVGRRHDLRAVVGVDLVAVVLRRVVRRGDHHAGRRAEVLHGEGEHRRGQHPRQEVGREPGGGEDRGRVAGEVERAVPGVEADDDRRAGLAVRGQPGGQPGGGAAHDGAVHPVRAGPQRPAQARGAEGERGGEPVGQLGVVAGVEQGLQLGRGGRVDLVGDPGPHGVGRRSTRLSRARRHFVDAEAGGGEAAADEAVGRVGLRVRRASPRRPRRRPGARSRARGPSRGSTCAGCWPRCPTRSRSRAPARAGRRRPAGRSRRARARSPARACRWARPRTCRCAGTRPASRSGRRSSGRAPRRRPC